MALALISAQRGGVVCALDRPPNEAAVVGVPAFGTPAGVVQHTDGTLVVADARGGSIALQDTTGWHAYGSPGAGAGRFRNPTALAASGTYTFVVDAGNHRIVRLEELGPTGIAHGGWSAVGTRGSAAFQFSSPSGIAAGNGTVLVADTGNGRLVSFPIEAFDNTPPTGWSDVALPAGATPARPYGVARSSTGWAVSDVANARIHLLDEAFAVVDTVRADRLRLGVPAYLAFDALDRLIIADPSANEVRLLSLKGRQRTVWRCRGSNPRYPAPLFERIGGVCAAAQ